MKTRKKILLILLTMILIFQSISVCFIANAEEGEVTYSNAYNDLIKDQSFNPSDYPKLSPGDPKYYNIELITIAESEDNELFVYVYQPSGNDIKNFRASSINISKKTRGSGDEAEAKKYYNYGLELINSNDVFFKYKVKGFDMNKIFPTRYYEITSIYRPWSKDYGDAEAGGGNTISEVAFPVGKQFTIKTASDGSTSAQVEDVEYIRVTEKYVGFIRYEDDTPIFSLDEKAADAHFVAFDTDRQIDKLLEADVYYKVQSCTVLDNYIGDPDITLGEATEEYSYLVYDGDPGVINSISDGSLFTKSEFMFDRIQETSDFLNMEVPIYLLPGIDILSEPILFNDEARAELAKTKWVLSFVETDYYKHVSESNNNSHETKRYSRVGDVSILRLKFETDGVVYDLGVVDNKQTGSEDPAAVVEQQEWWQKIMMLLMIVLLVVVLSFLWNPLAVVLKVIWESIKFVFSVLIWLIGLPFRLISMLLGKRKRQ